MSNHPTTVSHAATSGDQLASLVALRTVLAKQIDACESSRDLAALTRQFTILLTLIESVTKDRIPDEDWTALEEMRIRRMVAAAVNPARKV